MQYNISYLFKAIDSFSPIMAKMAANTSVFEKKLLKTSETLQAVGKKMKKFGREFTANTAVLGVGVAVAGKQFIDIEHGIGRVMRSMNAAQASKESISDALGQSLKKGFNTEESSKSLSLFMKTLNSGKAALAQFGAAQKLALATDTNLDEASAAISQILPYIKEGKSQAADMLYNTLKSSKTELSSLANNFPKLASLGEGINIPAEELLATVSVLSTKLGKDALPVVNTLVTKMTSINGMGAKIKKDGFAAVLSQIQKASPKNLDKLGFDAANITRALNSLDASGLETIAKASEKFKNSAMDVAATEALTELGRQLSSTWGDIKTMLAGYFSTLKPVVSATLSFVSFMANMLNKMPNSLKALISFPILAIAAFGPLTVLLGSTVSLLGYSLKGVTTLIKVLTFLGNGSLVKFALLHKLVQVKAAIKGTIILVKALSFGVLGLIKTVVVFLATNPIGWVILAIGALIGLTVLLYRKWDKMSPPLKKIVACAMPLVALPVIIIKNWDKILTFFKKFADKLKAVWAPIHRMLIAPIGNNFNLLPPSAGDVVNKKQNFADKFFNPKKYFANQAQREKEKNQQSSFEGELRIVNAPEGSRMFSIFKGPGQMSVGLNNAWGTR